MALSLCCLTSDPPEQVAAALASARDIADEVVLAWDDRSAADRVAAYTDLADVCFPVRFGLLEEHLEELHARCSGDWIFRIDTDEMASPALRRELPALLDQPGIEQIAVPRRWLHPDRTTWLDEVPWWPDFQLRVVRPAAGPRFDTRVHRGIVPSPARAYAHSPIYHFACAVSSRSDRQARATMYDALSPELTGVGGRPMHWYYDPETYASRTPPPLPVEDRGLVSAFFSACR